MYIHKEGRSYVLIATLLFVLVSYFMYLFTVSIPWLGIILWTAFFGLYFWVWWFFRMPRRQITLNENQILAPCDGKVVVIEETMETEFFKKPMLQISIFMSPLNVHVNRNPMSGKVSYFKYHRGKYLVAWHPKSSTENERTTVVLENGNKHLLMRQIAGAVARRICWYVKEGDVVDQYDEFGFIKFGSRVDVFLPVGTKIDVQIGEKTFGGQTVLGVWS